MSDLIRHGIAKGDECWAVLEATGARVLAASATRAEAMPQPGI